MKELTYGRQIFLGIVGLGIGHLLWYLTGNGLFVSTGWIFYGALFVIHPVWPESAAAHKNIKKLVRVAGVIIILMGCMIRSGDEQDFWQTHISDSLGIDAGNAEVLESMDDHGGFQGDGTMYAVLSFLDERLENLISAPGGWYALPLTDNLTTLIYGTRTQTTATGPFIGVTMPKVEEGYYFFYDRLNDCYTDDAVLTKHSYNYTIAIYDIVRDCLYYCEYDT